MDQVLEDNRIGLEELVEQYKNKREECPEVGRHLSLARRMVIGTFKRNNLLDQEFSFQKKMGEAIGGIIENNKLENSQLKEYSHALKTLTKKYSAESTNYILITLLLSFGSAAILKAACPILTDFNKDFLDLVPILLGLVMIFLRGIINDTMAIYEELILLIDKYLDRKKK
jgi:hypothetical protein